MDDNKERILDAVTEAGGSAASALIGAGIGTAVAGPVGTIGGALVGTAIERAILWAGKEIKERCLSKAEHRKIGTVFECATEKINFNLKAGKKLRNDDFFQDKFDERSAAEEILEGTLLAAQRENEEKKLPYIANLYANINFDSIINRHMANQLIRLASDTTYRQLVILRAIGAYQTGDLKNAPPRRNTAFKSISGYNNISIATEIFDLYRKSLITSESAIFDAAGITPSHLAVNGIGALMYNLMDLPHMPFDDDAKVVIAFLAGVSHQE